MSFSVTVSPIAEAKLREKAAASGQPLDVYASQVLEHAATTPSIDEILAPFRKQVAESGMSDQELDTFFEDVRDKAFQERHRRPA